MLHRTIPILLSLLTLCVISCAHRARQQAIAPDYSGFVRVAEVESRSVDHVERLLKHAGIQSWSLGAEVSLILVAPGTESQAASLLRVDSTSQKYWIRFH